MIDIRIVCTHDAVSFAETLMRLLAAEEHRVRLVYGRNSLNELESAKSDRDAVMLIWSYDAPSQHYMLEWLHGIDDTRLIQVARAPGAPRSDRRAPVIDFTNWRGERGARAWIALNDRLRAVTRAMEPAKPPPRRAAMALGLASVAAVTSAVFVRMNEEPMTPVAQEASETTVAAHASSDALGGPLVAVEPASMEDVALRVRPIGSRLQPLEITAADLTPLAEVPDTEIRDPTLIERITEFNPLRIGE